MVPLRCLPIWLLTVLVLAPIAHSNPPNKRIFNGTGVSIADYPYVASLAITYVHTHTGIRRYELSSCPGSIISTRWILSAAHCLEQCMHNICSVKARSGSTFFSRGGNLHYCDLALIHSMHQNSTMDHDISLVRSASFSAFNGSSVSAIAFTQVPPRIGTYATAVGWAHSPECGSDNTDQLRRVSVEVLSNDQCKLLMYASFRITEGMMCVGLPPLKMGVSPGDSGAPLIINGTLFGVVSWGYDCSYQQFSQVYVNVSYYRNWIEGNIQSIEKRKDY